MRLPSDDLEHILRHTSELWEELRGKRIFVTGGTGFFGCWLLESFVEANEKLGLEASATVLTRNPEAFHRKAPHLASNAVIRLHKGDVRDFDFPYGAFSHVIHAATDASVKLNDEDPLLMLDTIVQGTQRVLQFARRCGALVCLLISSGAIYGKQPSHLTHVPEEYMGGPDPLDPRSAYGQGKRTAELLCTLYARQHSLVVKIARCFAFVGPYLPLDAHFAVGNFILDALKGGPIRVKGDGTAYRSYLYGADLAIWLWTILFRGVSCRPYNVGSDEGISLGDLAFLVAERLSPKREVRVMKKSQPGKEAERYVPSVSRAEFELKLKRTIELPEAIERTLGWTVESSRLDTSIG